MLAYRSWASRTSERLPNKASASSKNRMALAFSAAAKMRSRFFSVSPMYLLTTPDRSILYRSSPSSPAITSAAIVLPVPDGPANSAVTPLPSDSLAAESPFVEHPVPVRDLLAHLLQLRERVLGQHDLRPVVHRLDLIGQPVKRGVGLGARGAEQVAQPEPFSVRAVRGRRAQPRLASGQSDRVGDLLGREPEPSGQLLQCRVVDGFTRRSQARPPVPRALLVCRHQDVHWHQSPGTEPGRWPGRSSGQDRDALIPGQRVH